MDAALASFIPNIILPHSSNLIRPESFIQVKIIQHFLHLSFGQRRSILGWHTSRYGTVLVCCTRVSVCYLLIVPDATRVSSSDVVVHLFVVSRARLHYF